MAKQASEMIEFKAEFTYKDMALYESPIHYVKKIVMEALILSDEEFNPFLGVSFGYLSTQKGVYHWQGPTIITAITISVYRKNKYIYCEKLWLRMEKLTKLNSKKNTVN